MSKNLKKYSKFMSLVLRHKPEEIGLELDENGWAKVDELLAKMQARGKDLDRSLLDEVVETNDKKRFAFSVDGQRIRASQGHSLKLDLGLEEKSPPEILYHGTATRNMEIIFKEGLKRMSRHHVHLSSDQQTAIAVGSRYGKPVILEVASEKMFEDGFKFFRAENGVWLTDNVPFKFLDQYS
jgi:putative RNA 2'-phosphotransferase